jgi:hypothetical protein
MESRSQKHYGDVAAGVLLGGVFLWGAWSLVPLVVGAVAAVMLVAMFAAGGVLSLPGWAIGLGLGGLIFAGGTAWLLRSREAKELMLWSLKIGGKAAALLLLASSLLRVFGTQFDEPVHPPGTRLADIEGSLTQAMQSFSEAALWGAVVVMPVVLLVVAARVVQQEIAKTKGVKSDRDEGKNQ